MFRIICSEFLWCICTNFVLSLEWTKVWLWSHLPLWIYSAIPFCLYKSFSASNLLWHSDLDWRIVSKKDFQTSFLGQEHLIVWYISVLIYIIANNCLMDNLKLFFTFWYKIGKKSTRKLTKLFDNFVVLTILQAKNARKSV